MAKLTAPVVLVGIAGVFAFYLFYPISQGRMPFRFGLDLAGGVQVSYAPDLSNPPEQYRGKNDRELLELAKGVLENRLATKLKAEPDVVIRGDNTILVTIPEVKNQRQVAEIVGKTFRLTLRLVLEEKSSQTEGPDIFPYRGGFYRLDSPAFSGDMLDLEGIGVKEGDSTSLNPEARAPRVGFRFRPPHDREFAEFTEKHIGKQMAILIDDQIQIAPVIRARIGEGGGVIEGGYTEERAREEAAMLRSGALPIALRVESMLAIGPTLGESVRKAGTTALLWSLLILFLIVLIAYLHRPWLLLAGTLAYGILIFSLLGLVAAFGLTIDVPAMAGIILSIGLGMDAFIIVFESLEIKLRKFKPTEIAEHCSTILREIYSFRSDGRVLFHSNTTTLIAVLPLFFVERVRYMMYSVVAGMLASLYTVVVTRSILQSTRLSSMSSTISPIGWMRGRKSRLFSISKPYIILTGLAVAVAAWLSITSLVGKGSLRTGAEFHSGTQLLVDFPSATHGEEFLAALRASLPDATLTPQVVGERQSGVSGGQRLLITLDSALETPEAEPATSRAGGGNESKGNNPDLGQDQKASDVKGLSVTALGRLVDAKGGKLMRVDTVGSRISHQRLLSTFGVVAFVLLMLPLYVLVLQRPLDSLLTHRNSQSPLTAPGWMASGVVLALFHDFAFMLITCWVLNIPLSMAVIAAMMTVLGYSVNDSIVLASQIENKAENLKADGPMTKAAARELVGKCIDAVLSRSVLTAATTLAVPIVVALLHIQDLYDFSVVVGVGVVAGALSSIYVLGECAVRSLYARAQTPVVAREPGEDGHLTEDEVRARMQET